MFPVECPCHTKPKVSNAKMRIECYSGKCDKAMSYISIIGQYIFHELQCGPLHFDLRGSVAIQLQHIHHLLLFIWLLQHLDLAVYHGTLHVVPLPRRHPLQQRLLVRHPQIDKVYKHVMIVVGGYADDVSVLAFERGAGDDDAIGGSRVVGRGEACDGGLTEKHKPIPAVCVREGSVLRHFLLVGLGVVLRGRSGLDESWNCAGEGVT